MCAQTYTVCPRSIDPFYIAIKCKLKHYLYWNGVHMFIIRLVKARREMVKVNKLRLRRMRMFKRRHGTPSVW